jgi:type III pantothenate kinase
MSSPRNDFLPGRTSRAAQLLIAVDVGNSRVKFGCFDRVLADQFTQPVSTLDLPCAPRMLESLAEWFRDHVAPLASSQSDEITWLMASVNRPTSLRLTEWLQTQAETWRVRELSVGDLPLSVALVAPQRVGLDRLLAAVAVNRLRDALRPAIIIDLGSAITVDVVSVRGVFCGGAILPGIGMSARALGEQTDLLPHLPLDTLSDPPPALGTSTESAITSGLFWGSIGAMKELVAQLARDLPTIPQLFITGGAAPSVATYVSSEARYLPHLVLGGIALTYASIRS